MPGDSAAIAAIYRPYVETTHFTFEEIAPDSAEIGRRIANPLHPWLVAETGGQVIGYASTSPMRTREAYRWSIETGIYLVPEALGAGVGKRLLSSHLELLKKQGFVTVVAGIALPNDASIALHKSLGFTLSGVERGVGFKLGKWIDVARWQHDLAIRIEVPSEPVEFSLVKKRTD